MDESWISPHSQVGQNHLARLALQGLSSGPGFFQEHDPQLILIAASQHP